MPSLWALLLSFRGLVGVVGACQIGELAERQQAHRHTGRERHLPLCSVFGLASYPLVTTSCASGLSSIGDALPGQQHTFCARARAAPYGAVVSRQVRSPEQARVPSFCHACRLACPTPPVLALAYLPAAASEKKRAGVRRSCAGPVGCWAFSRKHNPRGPVVPVTGTRSLSTLRVLLVVEVRVVLEAEVREQHSAWAETWLGGSGKRSKMWKHRDLKLLRVAEIATKQAGAQSGRSVESHTGRCRASSCGRCRTWRVPGGKSKGRVARRLGKKAQAAA